jgi:hypothetical protein
MLKKLSLLTIFVYFIVATPQIILAQNLSDGQVYQLMSKAVLLILCQCLYLLEENYLG